MKAPLLSHGAKARTIRSLRQKRTLGPMQLRHQKRVAKADLPWRGTRLNLFRNPPSQFSPGVTTRQNRVNEHGHKWIKTFNHKAAGVVPEKSPLAFIEQEHIRQLDPTGKRTALFARNNPRRVKPGDILLVRFKNGDPFSGVCINIRQRHAKVDWAILLRNHLTRVPTEMWFKIYSPNIEAIEIAQRTQRRARRVNLYYMRKPKHDKGSVEGVVRSYLRTKAGPDAPSTKTAKKKGKKKRAKN